MNRTTRRTVVITGISGGTGRATARLFAGCGDRAALLARGRAGLDAVTGGVREAGVKALPVVTHVAEWGPGAAGRPARPGGSRPSALATASPSSRSGPAAPHCSGRLRAVLDRAGTDDADFQLRLVGGRTPSCPATTSSCTARAGPHRLTPGEPAAPAVRYGSRPA